MRHVVRFIMAVLLLAAGLSGAGADPASDAAFLAWLGQQPPSAEPMPGIGTPAPVPKECSVSRDCGDGNTVACVGTYSCQYTYRGVKCDGGGEIACPNFCEVRIYCCGTFTTCGSTSGDCHYTDNGISCNGYESTCDTPPWGCGPPPP
jgi:hypothetical protein